MISKVKLEHFKRCGNEDLKNGWLSEPIGLFYRHYICYFAW